MNATSSQTGTAFEKHYSPQELSEQWGLSYETLRVLFRNEPGVIRIGRLGRQDGKRDHVTIRIPASVAARVHERLSRENPPC